LEAPTPSAVQKAPSKPSNAPSTGSTTFADLGLNPLLVTHLQSKIGTINPASVQPVALPILTNPSEEDINARDLLIQSQTGSGKTTSFPLPIIFSLSTHFYVDHSIGMLTIIIAPPRELAK
ncbi:P-loop containing nucleoside triphosphate hydrolase protein, partial [Suillus paluster]|uniref:P-loop containing nucleoside triphosphate hydrolase protein n=1 Tax=Suillus paluster TaxID=48578 RepID=UPI001B867470